VIYIRCLRTFQFHPSSSAPSMNLQTYQDREQQSLSK
jgi:hypothetical protein